MLSWLGFLSGIFTGIIPELLKIFKDIRDKKHEIEMYKLQMEMIKLQGTIRIEELQAQADIKESEVLYKYSEPKPIPTTGFKTVDVITGIFNAIIFLTNGLVRPIVTYCFVTFYGLVKYGQYKTIIASGIYMSKYDVLVSLWSDIDHAVFATVIGHWFGQRMMRWAVERYSKTK